MKEFKSYNPYIILLHFLAVIGFCMLVMHPMILLTAYLSGILYLIILTGFKKALVRILSMSLIIPAAALFNAIFNHEGLTVLWYFPWENPLTLEAMIYGGFSGIMLSSVILWFSCFNIIFKSDKILYVFGKVAPSVSLVISMILGFVPKFTKRVTQVIKARRAVGRHIDKGRIRDRIKTATGVLSSVVGWSLESSIETAQSMKARGYASGKRTAFSIYKFESADWFFLIFLILTLVVCAIYGGFDFSYYPSFKVSSGGLGVIGYSLLCYAPAVAELFEVKRWRR